MAISKKNRALIVINHLSSGDTDHLYRFIEGSARTTIDATLSDDYEKIVRLYDKDATFAKFIKAIRTLGARASVKRIDAIVMLHGSPGVLYFKDGAFQTSYVGTQIAALKRAAKLRMVYNTSCYGDSHSVDFIAAGFKAAIGSKKVNANAAVEFAPLLSLWQFDQKLVDCLAPTVVATPAADTASRLYGQANNTSWRNDVDSTKVLRGNKQVRISA
jgi:hypothetical protein